MPKGGSPFGSVTTSAATFDENYPNPQNVFTLINIRGGVTPANTSLLDRRAPDLPGREDPDRDAVRACAGAGHQHPAEPALRPARALSIVISIFGIVNTLVLTVFERTRELGMLRAVGMTQVQVRRMIRHESVVTSLIGAALGLPIGIAARGADRPGDRVLRRSRCRSAQLIVFLIAAVIAGIVAAIFPARRASRLNVLQALQYE